PEVAGQVAELPGVTEAFSVTGDVDLIAMVRVAQHEDLAGVIADQISKIDGVLRTQTYIAFQTYSKHDLDAAFALGLDDCRRARPPLAALRLHRCRRYFLRAVVLCGIAPAGELSRGWSLQPAGGVPLQPPRVVASVRSARGDPGGQPVGGSTVVDRPPGMLQAGRQPVGERPLGGALQPGVRYQGSGRVQQHGVPDRSRRTSEQVAGDLGVLLR